MNYVDTLEECRQALQVLLRLGYDRYGELYLKVEQEIRHPNRLEP